jgi:hypothetical protein
LNEHPSLVGLALAALGVIDVVVALRVAVNW